MIGDVCSGCGLKYEDFKTDYDFRDIYVMLWVPEGRAERWKYKTRHTILGKWHEIKESMWKCHLYECEGAEEAAESQRVDEGRIPDWVTEGLEEAEELEHAESGT